MTYHHSLFWDYTLMLIRGLLGLVRSNLILNYSAKEMAVPPLFSLLMYASYVFYF